MIVSESIGNEAVFFLVSLLCGMGLVFVYDFLRIFRRVVAHGNIWIGIEDIAFWIFCAVAVFLLLYQQNDGMMRAFSFLGIFFGGTIYAFLFSRFVVKIGVFIFGFVWKILGIMIGPVLKIIKKILTFLGKWLKKLLKTIKIGLCKL